MVVYKSKPIVYSYWTLCTMGNIIVNKFKRYDGCYDYLKMIVLNQHQCTNFL